MESYFETSNTNFQISTLVVGSVALIVSLAWNNAITSLIDQYVPAKYANSKNAWFKIVYAIIMTLLAIIFVKVFFPSQNK
jgi:hypothetical protein